MAEEDYESVQFRLLYYQNCNTVYFDNVQLVKKMCVRGSMIEYIYDSDILPAVIC